MYLFEHSVRCGEDWRLGGVFSHPGQAVSGSDGAGSLVGIRFQTGVMWYSHASNGNLDTFSL